MRCTCPDVAVPCKHIAATFYLLAERFDDDPFELLLWRGRSRAELLADLLADLQAGAVAGGIADAAPDADQPRGTLRVLADLPTVDVRAALDRFWLPPVPLPPAPPTLDAPVDLLVRQLPDPPPALGGRATLEALGPLYLALAATTRRHREGRGRAHLPSPRISSTTPGPSPPTSPTLRHRLHAEPEIGLDLPRTQEKVLAALDGLPLEISTGGTTTSVTAVLRGGRPRRRRPVVLLRGDMDALPVAEEAGVPFRPAIAGGDARLRARPAHRHARRGGPGARRPPRPARRRRRVHVPAGRGGLRRRPLHDRRGRARRRRRARRPRPTRCTS